MKTADSCNLPRSVLAVEERDSSDTREKNSNVVDVSTSLSCGFESTKVLTPRRRSLSVATGKPSVESVIVKAKRAASHLWLLLHAQSCLLADKCPHTGCREAKLMHLHLKTCPAGAGFPCPVAYYGCDQARKLLAHYRKCRSNRARQANNARRELEQQNCLVCSLVARQAKTMLEKSSPSARKHFVKHSLSPPATESTTRVAISTPFNSDNMLPPPPRAKPSSRGLECAPTLSTSDCTDFELGHSVPKSVTFSNDVLSKSLDTSIFSDMKFAPSLSRSGRDFCFSTEESSTRIIPISRQRSASVGDSPAAVTSPSFPPSFEPIAEEASLSSRESNAELELQFDPTI